jgi:hypothetical protein
MYLLKRQIKPTSLISSRFTLISATSVQVSYYSILIRLISTIIQLF